MTYVPPPSFYDIFPNDFQHWSFASPPATRAGGAPAETPRYGLQNPGGGVPAPLLTTTPVEAPAIQIPSLVETASSTDSSEAPTPDSSAPSYGVIMFQDLTKEFSVGADMVAPTTKRKTKKRDGPRRHRGPNRRCKGSGYYDLLVRFSVQLTMNRTDAFFAFSPLAKIEQAPGGGTTCFGTGVPKLLRDRQGQGSLHRPEAPFGEAAL